MIDEESLRNDIGNELQLFLVDIAETVLDFVKSRSKECPIEFFSMDVGVVIIKSRTKVI